MHGESERLVSVPESRLNELLHAEIAYLESVPTKSLSMQDVFEARDPQSMANFIQSDNPSRLAFRIRLVESLQSWKQVPEMVYVHDVMSEWYRQIRLTKSGSAFDLEEFTKVIVDQRKEGRDTTLKLCIGMLKLREICGDEYDDAFYNKWMDSFFLSRIGSNMLLDHFVCVAPKALGGKGRRHGIIAPDCDPTLIVKNTAALTARMCKQQTGYSVPFSVVTYKEGRSGPLPSDEHPHFSYIPDYLGYIMREVLKNSFSATVKNAKNAADVSQRPVKILVASEDRNIIIRVSDQAGGIPRKVSNRVFSYLYGAAASPDKKAGAMEGYGVGLPLSRLHAQYLGGQFEIRSYPGYGTDAYLLLRRMAHEQVEHV